MLSPESNSLFSVCGEFFCHLKHFTTCHRSWMKHPRPCSIFRSIELAVCNPTHMSAERTFGLFWQFCRMTLRTWHERICWILTEMKRGSKFFFISLTTVTTGTHYLYTSALFDHIFVCTFLFTFPSLDRAQRVIVGSKESQLQGANQCA